MWCDDFRDNIQEWSAQLICMGCEWTLYPMLVGTIEWDHDEV